MELMHKPRTVGGVVTQVEETVWTDGGRSFHLYRLNGDEPPICVTENDAFDHSPTDDEIRKALGLPNEPIQVHDGVMRVPLPLTALVKVDDYTVAYGVTPAEALEEAPAKVREAVAAALKSAFKHHDVYGEFELK